MSRREQQANDGARISAKPQGGGVEATMDAHCDRHNGRGGRR